MLKSEMYKYTFVKTASFMSDFVVNKYYNHGAFYGIAGHFLLVVRRGGLFLLPFGGVLLLLLPLGVGLFR